jgi:hypothetical protein
LQQLVDKEVQEKAFERAMSVEELMLLEDRI